MEMYGTTTPPELTAEQQRTAALLQAVGKGNEFLGRTREGSRNGYVPRPTADAPVYRHADADHLRAAQAQWDAAEAWEQYWAERKQERQSTEQVAREAARQEHADAVEAAFVEGLRARYFAADPGASEDDFQRDLPEIRRQQRIAAALGQTNDEAARRSQAAMYRGW